MQTPLESQSDHCAALPCLTEKLAGFKGRVFMTHATKAVMALILADYLVLGHDNMEYDKNDPDNCLGRVIFNPVLSQLNQDLSPQVRQE